jgi:prepilin-type N-terminal cleavage/methylation domain-containing protein
MKPIDSCLSARSGLTLTELVVAMAVAGILVGAGYGIFTTQHRTYVIQDQVVEMQQNARTAMNALTRDLRMAGHGVPDLWSVDINGNTYSSKVTAIGSTMTLLGCFGPPEGYLARSAAIGDTRIVLDNDEQLKRFDDSGTGDRRYIFIGEYDKAIITELDYDDNTLTLDTDPGVTGNQGLKKRYPATRLRGAATIGDIQITVSSTNHFQTGDILILGDERLYVIGIAGDDTIDFDTDPKKPGNQSLRFAYPSGTRVNPIPVYRVQALRYHLGDDGILRRHDLETNGQRRAVAENIEAVDITRTDSGTYHITLTAKTDGPDEAGRYRGRTYRFTVRVRNRL